jgi:hypothetical protein
MSSGKPRGLRVLETGEHPRVVVDPFRMLPCQCDTVLVHITNGFSIGDDLVECLHCELVVRLGDLYERMPKPPMP